MNHMWAHETTESKNESAIKLPVSPLKDQFKNTLSVHTQDVFIQNYLFFLCIYDKKYLIIAH